jgi:hypothetical protein
MKFTRRSFMLVTAGIRLVPERLRVRVGLQDRPGLRCRVALGYKTDASKVDHAKYANYQAGQACASCQFFQGKAGDATAPCTIFAGKQVNAKGWCSAYVKKA